MLRSIFLCFSLVALCAHTRAQAQDTTPPARPAVEPAQPASSSSQPAAPAPAPSAAGQLDASPEAKAAAVPVDRDALLAPEEAPKPAHHDMESDPLFVPGAVLIGGGGAALLASLFTGMGAHGIYTSLEDDCKNDICTMREDRDRIDSGKTLAVVSTVLTGVGIAAVGVGTVFMVLAATREEKPETQPRFSIAKLRLTGGPAPLGLGAAGSF